MPDREPMDEDELKALLSAEIRAAVNYDSTELSGRRATAIEYYEGTMSDTPALEGRSRVVSRDVADTIGLMTPQIIRVFTASGRIVDYKPVGNEDEEFADCASDYCNYLFMKENAGYRILWDTTHDSLTLGNGIVKHWWDSTPDCTYEVMTSRTEEQIALITQDKDVEVVAQSEGEPVVQMDPMTQMPVMIPTFNIKVKREVKIGRLRVDSIEPENFLMNSAARCVEEARFVAHRDWKTRSELIEMGFDPEIVNELPAYQNIDRTEEGIARGGYSTSIDNDVGHESMREIELYECYEKVDMDGDGVAEMVRAYMAGNGGASQLLDWEEWEDDVPFSDIPCSPRPHRWDAMSITDETMDIQRVKTVVKRGFIDNLYDIGVPMQEAEQGSVINPEMLAAPKFGGIIWRKKGSQPVIPHIKEFIGDKLLLGLDYLDRVIEKRTGVSRATAALDPDALQNQTATASQLMHDAAYSQTELVARNMAELGWKRVFRQILHLVVKHQTEPRIVRFKDKPVKIDPSVWNTDMDVSVNVGLGTGSRDRDMAMLNVGLQNQLGLSDRLAQGGFINETLDMLPKVALTMKRIAESAGLQNPEDYYPQYTDEQVEGMKKQAADRASQPDPKVQAQLQIEQGKLEHEKQKTQLEIIAAAQKEREQRDADLVVKRAEMEKDERLEGQKQAWESVEKEKDRQHEIRMEQMKLNAQAIQAREQMANDNMQSERQAQREGDRGDRDREQTREIELAKLDAKDEAGPDGKRRIVNKNDGRHEELKTALAELKKPRNRKVVRDPKTNRISEIVEVQ